MAMAQLARIHSKNSLSVIVGGSSRGLAVLVGLGELDGCTVHRGAVESGGSKAV